MRSSSVKSIVAALSIVVAVTVSVPAANAAPAFARDREVMRDRAAAPRDGMFDVVRRLLIRFRGVRSNVTPTIPTPAPGQ